MQKIRKDLIGQQFGNLTVIGSTYRGTGKRRTFLWVCKCGCGKETQVRENRIDKSLGCQKCARVLSARRKDPKLMVPLYSQRRRIYLQYVRRASVLGKPFDLTEEQFFELIEDDCFYCGEPPEEKNVGNTIDGKLKRNGVDRLDSNKGYVKDNVVTCCTTCNLAKLDKNPKEFLDWIEKVYKFQKKI